MAKTRTELVHCDNCGEDYAATYRRCPFCNAKPGARSAGDAPAPLYEDTYYDEEPATNRRGGKRLAGGKPPRRGGGDNGQILRTVLYLLSALVIVAAVWIVGTKLLPKLLPTPQPSSSVEPSVQPSIQPSIQPPSSTEPSPSWEPLPSLDPAVTDDPLGLDSPDLPSVEPDPLVSQAPAGTPTVVSTPAPTAAAGSLTLSSTDFTMSPRYPTYQMEITGVGRSQATYSIKNEKVATVSSTGLITAVGNGTTTLTVTDKNSGSSATCTVRVSGMSAQAAASSAAPAPSQSGSGSSGATLSTTDFTLSQSLGYSAQLTVRGGTAAGWSSSNESVATVSSNGTVTGHDKGTARITCTLDTGETLRAIVRVN